MNEKMNEAPRAALKWLRDHGGSGVFGKPATVLLARGEWAPFDRSTWNRLRDAGLCAIDGRRIMVTDAGHKYDCGKTKERRVIDHLGGPY